MKTNTPTFRPPRPMHIFSWITVLSAVQSLQYLKALILKESDAKPSEKGSKIFPEKILCQRRRRRLSKKCLGVMTGQKLAGSWSFRAHRTRNDSLALNGRMTRTLPTINCFKSQFLTTLRSNGLACLVKAAWKIKSDN